jgi:hypothetical protein
MSEKLGTGNFQYEWVDNWAKLPKGMELGYTHGVVVDAKDNVYIHNQSKDAVIVFDRDGNFIKSWGPEYAGGAHGEFLSKEPDGREYLFLADYAQHRVAKHTLDGKVVFTVGMPDRKDIYASVDDFKPTDVCTAPNGDFYVFDGYGKPWIHQYSKDAKYIRSIGGEGSEPGKLSCPHGGWVDTRRSEPELYVADRGNNRIQVMTLDGKHKRFLKEEMKQPCCFYQFKDYMVIPDLQARVTIYDKNDKPAAILGDDPEAPKTDGWPNIQAKLKKGKFSSPHAACVDSHEDIYVVEWISTGRITKLKRVK